MILITGAAGYIGSQIVHTLHRTFTQPKIVGVDNLSAGTPSNLPAGFECMFGDVASRRFMGNLIRRYKVDAIIHCAASVSVPESVEKPLDYYHNNTVASLALIETARDCRVESFVFASTAAVYGNPEFGRPMREDDVCRPVSPYGRSKLMVEDALRDLCGCNRNMSAVILRYFNVAGADPLGLTGQARNAKHLITRACRAALGGEPLTIYGEGDDQRDYVHVEDVAAANMGALSHAEMHSGCATFNVCTGVKTSVMDVIEAVTRVSGKKVPRVFAQRREGDPSCVIGSNHAITRTLSWEPRHDLDAIVEDALRWQKKTL